MCIKASFYSNLGCHWQNFTNIYQVYIFFSVQLCCVLIQWVYAIVIVQNIKKLTLNHFNVKLYYFGILPNIKTAAYYHPNTTFHKNSNSNILLTNTITIIAQYTAVFSTIAHLLLHNRYQFFSHFLMVIEQFALFIAQCCLNNWFEVLSTRATLIQYWCRN